MALTAAVTRLEPADAAGVADLLRQATDQHQAVVIQGHGTKAQWGARPTRTDVVLSLARLRDPIEHCAGDLTVTAPAGASLADINALLAHEGQWLPLDPWAGGASTVGGLLATNDSGPRRIRYGAPRDLVIGIDCVLADGRRAKAGGRVVKNVAGYDLGRLLCGSFGSLAVITQATFKLSPLPPASRTVVIDLHGPDSLSALARAIGTTPVTPSAVEFDAPSPRLLVRFETTASAADEQAAHVIRLAARHRADATVLQGHDEAEAWASSMPARTLDSGTLLKVTVLPTQVCATLDWIGGQAAAGRLRWRVGGRVTLGVLMAHLDGETSDVIAFVTGLRATVLPAGGHVAVLTAPAAVAAAVPTWDQIDPAAARVMRAVKAQFDPQGTLCPGGGPAGLG